MTRTTIAPGSTTAGTKVVRLSGGLCVQRGTPMLQAFATADLINEQSQGDVYDPQTGTGYQRVAVQSRMRAAATYYDERHGRMPNPLLINIREEDFERVRVEVTSGDSKAYRRAIETGGDWIGGGFIEFEPDVLLWIYDGQHREGRHRPPARTAGTSP
jgi:hypothetical protein